MLARGRILCVSLFLMCVTAGSLLAHPLGNFTINHLTVLTVAAQRLNVRYVVDMAEIPTYQAMRATTPDGKLDRILLGAWARREAAEDVLQLQLAYAGSHRTFVLDSARATTRPGAGGLPTLYLVLQAHASLPSAKPGDSLVYRDDTYSGRLGWHDVVVAPATEPTHELTRYPSALLASPRAITFAEIRLDRDGRAIVRADRPPQASSDGAPAASQARSNQLSDMLARGTSDWKFVLLTVLVAVALGALHALEPGHGKTLLAISLVGARATVKQATILALALTVAHTIGVVALGVAINVFKGYFVPENIYPWITLGSGIIIAIIGARAIHRHTDNGHEHGHGHGQAHGHGHAHEHGRPAGRSDGPDHVHDFGLHGAAHTTSEAHDAALGHDPDLSDIAHARSHAIPGSAPLKFGGTVWAAMSGSVAPCPAALVVLLAAVALDQVAYGIFVVVAFSFGLAATLTALGIAVVRGANWLQRLPQFERFVRFGPFASAIVISTIGAVMVGQGFAEQTGASRIAITLLAALAIAGYAFAHPATHHRRIEAA